MKLYWITAFLLLLAFGSLVSGATKPVQNDTGEILFSTDWLVVSTLPEIEGYISLYDLSKEIVYSQLRRSQCLPSDWFYKAHYIGRRSVIDHHDYFNGRISISCWPEE